MLGKLNKSIKNTSGFRAQAIVEFAIALPVFLALVIGILEVGRLIFTYSTVTNASRNAARYASAVGLSDNGYYKYMYCDGIRDVARKSTYIIPSSNLTIDISYDSGPGTSSAVSGGCNFSGGNDVDVQNAIVTNDDNGKYRVTVTVTTQYQPLTRLVPIYSGPITSSNSRTILGIVKLGN